MSADHNHGLVSREKLSRERIRTFTISAVNAALSFYGKPHTHLLPENIILAQTRNEYENTFGGPHESIGYFSLFDRTRVFVATTTWDTFTRADGTAEEREEPLSDAQTLEASIHEADHFAATENTARLIGSGLLRPQRFGYRILFPSGIEYGSTLDEAAVVAFTMLGVSLIRNRLEAEEEFADLPSWTVARFDSALHYQRIDSIAAQLFVHSADAPATAEIWENIRAGLVSESVPTLLRLDDVQLMMLFLLGTNFNPFVTDIPDRQQRERDKTIIEWFGSEGNPELQEQLFGKVLNLIPPEYTAEVLSLMDIVRLAFSPEQERLDTPVDEGRYSRRHLE